MSRIDVNKPSKISGPASGGSTPDSMPITLAPDFELDEYRADLADLSLTEEQEREFLETLWSIMGAFARMGFSADVCGLIFEGFNEAADAAPDDGKLVASTSMEKPSNDRSDGGTA